jgi:hypothetical protein
LVQGHLGNGANAMLPHRDILVVALTFAIAASLYLASFRDLMPS